MERMKNAYMLVYERVSPLATESPSNIEQKEANENVTRLKALVAANEHKDSMTEALIEVMPRPVLNHVFEDNLQLMRDRQIFNADYFKFMLNVTKSLDLPPVLEYMPAADAPNPGLASIQLCVKFAMNSVARAAENHSFPEFVEVLKGMLAKNLPAARWLLAFLAEEVSLVSDFSLHCRDKVVRTAFAELVVAAIKLVSPHEEAFYSEEEDYEAIQAGQPVMKKRLVAVAPRFIVTVLGLLDNCPHHWTRFSEYFKIIYEFANLGFLQRKFYVERGMISKLGDLFLGEASPLAAGKKVISMGSRMAQPNFENLLKTFSLLVRSCVTQTSDQFGRPPTTLPGDLLPISATDKKILLLKSFYVQALSNNHCPAAIAEVMAHWSWNWENYTGSVIDVILDGLKLAHQDDIKRYFDVLLPFVQLEDSLQSMRLERLIGTDRGLIRLFYYYRNSHQRFSYIGIKHMLQVMEQCPAFANHMMSIRNDWKWMDVFLNQYNNLKPAPAAPVLQRQESRGETFDKYQKELQRLGTELDLTPEPPAPSRDPNSIVEEPDDAMTDGPGGDYYGGSSGGYRSSGTGTYPSAAYAGYGNTSGNYGSYGSSTRGKRSRDENVQSLILNVDDDERITVDYGPPLPGEGAIVPIGPVQDSGTSTGGSGDSWSCGLCTFENLGAMNYCEMCSSPRPK
eukprot:TRINITY_DN354_c0_g1_i14.p1 TRINITY_DN354_c0_g1~~TRINITY_DN354_c0_g1_i14.p1  ORF type:complete len:680 (+),score=311.35 TRINITY_DN354_c0_g1_i14:94-2133(+)